MLKKLIDNLLAAPYDFFVGTFFNLVLYLRALKINVLIFLFIFFIFTGPSQSIDLFNGLAMDGIGPNLIFWSSLTLLCLMMWYTSIHFLIRYDLTAVKDENKIQQKVLPTLPFLAGISIYLVALYGFSRSEVVPNNLGVYYFIGGVVVIVGVGLLRDSLTSHLKMTKGEDILKVLRDPVDARVKWTFLSRLDKFIIITGTLLYFAALVIVLILSFSPIKPVSIPLFFQASTIICLYFSGLLMLLLFLWSALGYRLFKVVILLYIILGAVFSNYNNNHAPRLLSTNAPKQETGFKHWLSSRFDLSEYSEENKISVYFVAAEGGGIRSMKWTALVLDQLYGSASEFGNHLYALSGVSGGSVGIVFQQAALPFCSGGCPDKLDQAVSEDFLSPVTLGLLAPDLFAQSFIPVPINEWDRSQWLEDSWSYSFRQAFSQAALDEGVNDYWNQHNLPNLFLNCTALETGQKAIISNTTLSPKYFGNVIDLEREINNYQPSKSTFPLKTAASMSARFPLVTSAAKTTTKNGDYNIVDGGYHDNTGLETIGQLLNEVIASTDTSILNKCRFSVLYIKNGETRSDEIPQSQDFLVDLNAPVSVFLNNWNDRTISMVKNFAASLATYRKFGIDAELHTIELDRNVSTKSGEEEGENINLPLGWYLSETSSKEITRQSSLLGAKNSAELSSKVAKSNLEEFDKFLAPLRTKVVIE